MGGNRYPHWGSEGLRPHVFACDVDLDPWSWAPLPSLGAAIFYAKQTVPRITGLRTKPPMPEVHEHNARMSENIRAPICNLLFLLNFARYFGFTYFATWNFRPETVRLATQKPHNIRRNPRIPHYWRKLREKEERRLRRGYSGRPGGYEEAIRQKYICMFVEHRRHPRREGRAVSPSPSTPAYSPPAWGPIVDMPENQRARALWFREARGTFPRVQEERTSADNSGRRNSERAELSKK